MGVFCVGAPAFPSGMNLKKGCEPMKKSIIALAMILLLTGCRGTSPSEVTASIPPSSDPQSVATNMPEPTQAPLWTTLTPEDLPTEPAELGSFFAVSSPQICLLSQVEALDLAFYGLNPGYGGGILLRDGDTLLHFDQEFGALPEIQQGTFSPGEEPELAVLWPLTGQSLTYDLVFYRPSPEGWRACPVSRDACVELISSEMDLDWNDKLHTLTLSFRGQSAVSQFPAEVAPGRLTLGHMCLFYESQGTFYMTMDAWSDVLEESLAVFRAEVAYDGEDFTLKNLQMDSMAGV